MSPSSERIPQRFTNILSITLLTPLHTGTGIKRKVQRSDLFKSRECEDKKMYGVWQWRKGREFHKHRTCLVYLVPELVSSALISIGKALVNVR